MNFANIGIEEIVTISFTLFAVIDILGSIPILISLKEKMGGHIRSGQATFASGIFMILFLFLGQAFSEPDGPRCPVICGSGKHRHFHPRTGNDSWRGIF